MTLLRIQAGVDVPVEEVAEAEHKEGAAAAEAADADMADAGDEAEDGVMPQKRKTAPEDVVSHSCKFMPLTFFEAYT